MASVSWFKGSALNSATTFSPVTGFHLHAKNDPQATSLPLGNSSTRRLVIAEADRRLMSRFVWMLASWGVYANRFYRPDGSTGMITNDDGDTLTISAHRLVAGMYRVSFSKNGEACIIDRIESRSPVNIKMVNKDRCDVRPTNLYLSNAPTADYHLTPPNHPALRITATSPYSTAGTGIYITNPDDAGDGRASQTAATGAEGPSGAAVSEYHDPGTGNAAPAEAAIGPEQQGQHDSDDHDQAARLRQAADGVYRAGLVPADAGGQAVDRRSERFGLQLGSLEILLDALAKKAGLEPTKISIQFAKPGLDGDVLDLSNPYAWLDLPLIPGKEYQFDVQLKYLGKNVTDTPTERRMITETTLFLDDLTR